MKERQMVKERPVGVNGRYTRFGEYVEPKYIPLHPYRSECTCACHYNAGIMHAAACCEPDPETEND